MTAPLRLVGRGKPVAALSAEEAAAFVSGGGERADQVAATGRAFRKAGWLVGAVGALFGFAGMGLAGYALVAWQKPPPEYIPLDPQGVPRETIRAVDAPQKFTDYTSKQYLQLFLDYCETYTFETAKVAAPRCLLLMSPPVQERYAAWFANTNPRSPQHRLGQTGSIAVAGEPIFSLVGKGRANTEVWNVQFTKVERKVRETTCTPWALNVGFQWRPDLPMSDKDRRINLAGFQAIEFTSQPDPSRRPEC